MNIDTVDLTDHLAPIRRFHVQASDLSALALLDFRPTRVRRTWEKCKTLFRSRADSCYRMREMHDIPRIMLRKGLRRLLSFI